MKHTRQCSIVTSTGGPVGILLCQHHFFLILSFKPERRQNLLWFCRTWAVWTREAGTLGRWVERDVLQKYKQTIRDSSVGAMSTVFYHPSVKLVSLLTFLG